MQSQVSLLPISIERKYLPLALAGMILLFSVLLADENHQIAKHQYGGFATIYGASSAMRLGVSPYLRVPGRYSYVYPPLYAFLGRPLLSVSLEGAARWMMLLDTACVLIAMLLLSKTMLSRLGVIPKASRILIVALSSSLILVAPIRNELHGLESNAPILLCFVLALHWVDRRPILAGLALAVAINIKYLPVVLIPYLLLRRRWSVAGATFLWTIALAMLPAFATGWSTNIHYLKVAIGGLLHLTSNVARGGEVANVPVLTQSTSLSITSGIARLSLQHGWSQGVAGGVALLVAAIWAAVIVAMLKSKKFPVFRWPSATLQQSTPWNGLVAIEWAFLIVTILSLGPNTQDRLLLLAAFPITLALTLAWFAAPRPNPAILATGIIIMALGVLLPVAFMGRGFTERWREASMPGWFVLVGFALIAWSALNYAASALPPTGRPTSNTTARVVTRFFGRV
ncbi:MAG TPA: glycosyltransferase family 87 protein [Tepidisphaeraceae bacterium]|jgi:hypothetical protein